MIMQKAPQQRYSFAAGLLIFYTVSDTQLSLRKGDNSLDWRSVIVVIRVCSGLSLCLIADIIQLLLRPLVGRRVLNGQNHVFVIEVIGMEKVDFRASLV